jgi:hypothetical protein
MRNLFFVVIALALVLGASAQEALPLRADGSITLWTVAGPLPNGPIMDHGKQCVGFYKDYLEKAGGESKAPHLIEVTPDKKVVWTFQDHKTMKTISSVQILDVPGDPTAGEVLH